MDTGAREGEGTRQPQRFPLVHDQLSNLLTRCRYCTNPQQKLMIRTPAFVEARDEYSDSGMPPDPCMVRVSRVRAVRQLDDTP